MLQVAIMVEGQAGLNWTRWQRLARAVQDLGFVGLYRSDHFTNSNPPDIDSLELWVSLTWLAANTQRLQFGPLVTPTTSTFGLGVGRWMHAGARSSSARVVR